MSGDGGLTQSVPRAPWSGWGLHPALWRLLRLQWGARWRSMRRQMRTVRGVVYSVLMLVVFGLMLVPSAIVAWQSPPVDPGVPRALLPPAMLALFLMTLLTGGIDTGVHFQPAEVDLLFPGPFSRRQLLLYRIVNMTVGLVLGSVFFSFMALRWSSLWLAGYLGVCLSLWLLTLLQMLLGVLVSVLAEATFARLRWGLVLGVGLILAAVAALVWPVGEEFDLLSGLQQLGQTPWSGVLFGPFTVLARLFTAQSAGELLLWLAASLGINLAVVGLILLCDSHYLEHSIAASQRMQARLQSARKGQALTAGVKPRGRLRAPRFPRLAGAGPIAWRQLTMALRNAHFALLLVGLLAGVATLPLLLSRKGPTGFALLAPAISMLVFLLPQLLQYDFRSDLERMDVLKSHPFAPWGVVLGQLATPVLLSTILAWVLLGGLWLAGLLSAPYLAVGLVLAPAANLFLYCSENLMFLLFPYTPTTGGVGDIHMVGRNMLLALSKLAALVAGLGIASGIGWLTWLLTGEELIAFLLGTLGALVLLSGLLILLMVLVYDRIDVNRFRSS